MPLCVLFVMIIVIVYPFVWCYGVLYLSFSPEGGSIYLLHQESPASLTVPW